MSGLTQEQIDSLRGELREAKEYGAALEEERTDNGRVHNRTSLQLFNARGALKAISESPPMPETMREMAHQGLAASEMPSPSQPVSGADHA